MTVMFSKLTTFLFAVNGLFLTVDKLPGKIQTEGERNMNDSTVYSMLAT